MRIRPVKTAALKAALLLLTSTVALAQIPPLPPGVPQDFPLTPRSRGPVPMQPPQTAQPFLPVDPLAQQALSATASFEPPVLRLMRFGEYRVTILGSSSGIELPDPLPAPDGLILDLTDKAPGTSIINGRRVMTMTFRYTVAAARPGTFLVPSFTATVAGTIVTVPAAQVIVQTPGPADLPYQPVKAVLDLPAGDYFVGQMLPARLLVFDTPDETVQAIANVTKPSGDFLFQSQSGSRRERIAWEGREQSALVTPLRLTPIKSGETDVTLQAIVFVNKLNLVGRSSGNTAQAMLDTAPVRVRVRTLPEAGRKPGFTGAIGKFELGRPVLSAAEAVVGDPITMTVTLIGEGNLEAIGAPTIETNETWQSFTPTMSVDRDVFSGRGTKTITYTLIPRVTETRAVPAIPFSYFDPERKEFIDLTIPPQPVSVKPSGAPPVPTAEIPAAAPAPEPEAASPKRAEPILTGLAEKPGAWRRSPSPIAWRGWFWAGQAAPALALLGLWGWRRRVDFLATHPEIVRRREARAAARSHLRLARSAARRRDADAFVTASIDAIRAAAAPLDTTEAQSLVLQEVLAKLPSEHDATVRRLFAHTHTKCFSGHGVEVNGVLELLPEVQRTVAVIERHQP
ncbi:MAG: BatD family protein [Chthoniobacteraceae bacterium]